MAKQKPNTRPVITTLPDFGKVPPQAIDMKKLFLGAIMLEKEAVITILDILKPASFYKRGSSEDIQSCIRPLLKGISC